MLGEQGAGLTVVVGLPGSGKTSLLAAYASTLRGPVAWYTVSGSGDVEALLWRLGLRLALLGDRRLHDSLRGGLDPSSAAVLLASSMDRTGLTLIVDDLHRLRGSGLRVLLGSTASLLQSSRIIVASRRRPSSLLAEVPGSRLISLAGLSMREAGEMLGKLGLRLEPGLLSSLYAATQGLPLLLRLYAELASAHGAVEALELLQRQGLRGVWRSLVESLGESEASMLRVLAELDEPVPGELAARLCRCRSPMLALYRLADMGLLDVAGEQYQLRDVVKRLRPRGPPPPRDLLVEAGDWFLGRGTPEALVRALRLYTRAGDEARITRLIRLRQARVGLEMSTVAGGYREALREALEKASRSYTRALILLELAPAYLDTGRPREALDAAATAYRVLSRTGDLASLLRAIGLLLYLGPPPGLEAEELAAVGLEAARQLERGGANALAYTALTHFYANLARHRSMRGDALGALEAAEKELEAARKTGVPSIEAEALIHVAAANTYAGRLGEARRHILEALDRALAAGSEPLIGFAYWLLAEIALREERYQEASRYAMEAARIYRGLAIPARLAPVLAIHLASLILQGLREAAAREARELANIILEEKVPMEGYELEALTAAAALAGAPEARLLAERAVESLERRKARFARGEAMPVLRVLHVAGMEKEAEFLESITAPA